MFASSSVCSGKSLDSKIAFETAKTENLMSFGKKTLE